MRKIKELETLARDLVGDDKTPDLFFVSRNGVIVAVDTCGNAAHKRWREISAQSPRVECALENRTYGVLSSVEPESDADNARLIVIDDYPDWARKAARVPA